MDVPKMKQLSDLPPSLVTDILLKLPLETLLRCRYVCKAWDGFFTNPEFVKRQLAASPIHFLERRVEEDRAIHFGRVVKVDGRLQAHTVDFTPRGLDLPDPTYWCVNSSNGLLCLVGRDDGSISVCNPLLGHSVSIPEPVNYKGRRRSEAIGFSAKDGLYKVLVGYQIKEEDKEGEDEGDKEGEDEGDKEDEDEGDKEDEEEEDQEEEEDEDCWYGFEIYTLGTREWRVIDSVEGCKPWHNNGMDYITFLHGSLHWVSVGVSTEGSRVRSLWSFNVETEKFQRLALPEPGDYHRMANFTEIWGKDEDMDAQIGIMNGCLWVCFCDTKRPTEADIWVMKEYGVKDSWTKILGFRCFIFQSEVFYPRGFLKYGYNGYNPGPPVTHPVLLYSYSHKDIVITDEEEPGKSHCVHVEKVLIADDSGDLICYNTKKRSERVVKFNTSSSHTYDFGYVTAYVPSFVSLQDVAKGEEVNVSRITYEAAQ